MEISILGEQYHLLAYLSMLGENTKIKFVIDSAPFKQGYFLSRIGLVAKSPKF